MGTLTRFLNPLVTALVLAAAPMAAAADRLDDLFAELQRPGQERWSRVEREILSEWSKSGSPTGDLLLQRGQSALARGDLNEAVEHLTALTDHLPDFAEGWNTRATAYFQQGRYGPAMSDIAQTLKLNPRHFGALTGLGFILEEVDRPEQALEAFRAAHAIHPHQPAITSAVERLERQVSGETL